MRNLASASRDQRSVNGSHYCDDDTKSVTMVGSPQFLLIHLKSRLGQALCSRGGLLRRGLAMPASQALPDPTAPPAPRAVSPEVSKLQCPCLCNGIDANTSDLPGAAGSERAEFGHPHVLMRDVGQDPSPQDFTVHTRTLTQSGLGLGPHRSLRGHQRQKTRQSSTAQLRKQ